MKMIRVMGLCIFLTLYSGFAWPVNFQAGFGKKEITPAEHFLPINIGGYFPRIQATGYRENPTLPTGKEEIYARSMVLQWVIDEGNPNQKTITIALTILDAVGISNRIIDSIVTGAEAAVGIPKENHFVGATHTHSAPDLQGPWGGVPDGYKNDVVTGAIEAVTQAHESLTSANMFVSKTTGPNRNRNRRKWGFTDKEITFVEFKDTNTGTTIGSLLNFAAHPDLLGKVEYISRDFGGYLVDHLEKQLGGTAIFANGVVGDVKPSLLRGETIQEYGERIAQAAIDSRDDQDLINPDSSEITITRIPWDLKMTGMLYRLFYLFDRLDYDAEWEGLRLKIPTTLGYLRFGDQLQVVTFPGESLTRNGFDDGIPTTHAIKEAMTAEYKLFLGLTGDALGYFVPSDEWWSCRNNFYEPLVSPGKHAGDEARAKLIAAIAADVALGSPDNIIAELSIPCYDEVEEFE